ncbi:hypothetical protein [Streptococcus iniae]|uniref:hypothetical protein n=1 Tax=Streptococcus iniae TaxID=1346 RepID=UPI002B2F8BB7|nr:hypothetical protein QYR57_08450 [Streptococcus iniae]
MVKVSTGTMATQASTVATTMSSRVTALNNAITQLSTFAGATRLQGTAYDNAKSYATATLTPMIQAMILYAESLSEKCTELQTLYASICGSEDLDSTVLEAKLSSDRGSLRIAEALLDRLADDPKPSRAAIRSTQGNIERSHKRIRSNQKKLDNLNRFNAQSATVFADITSAQNTVSQALTAVAAGFSGYNSTTGTFGKPATGQMDWTKQVKNAWNDRELKKQYDMILGKVANNVTLTEEELVAISKVTAEHPDRDLPKELLSYINSKYPEHARYIQGQGKTIYDGLALIYASSKLSKKGKQVYINHSTTEAGKKLEKFFGTKQYYSHNRIKNGKTSTRVTSKKGSKIDPNSYNLANDLNLNHGSQLGYGQNSWEDYAKTLGKGAKSSAISSIKSSASAGLTDVFTYVKGDGIKFTKSFKAAGVAGKSVAVVNVATSAIDIANGYNDTDQKAKDLGMKVGSVDYVQAQTGGIAIDTAKGVGVGVASTAVATTVTAAVSALAIAGAPIWLPAVAGVAATTALTLTVNAIDDKFNVTKNIKNAWINWVKG